MKVLFEDLDLGRWPIPRREERDKKSMEFVFDDEPLEQILYGKKLGGPTSANLYLPALKYIQGISRALTNRKIEEAAQKASELKEKGYSISAAMCFELGSIIQKIVPSFPNPIMKWDLSSLGDLADMMWDVAKHSKDNTLQEAVGTPIYRWYEYYQRYEDARNVLGALIRTYHDQNDKVNEAVFINNFAFEYLLEGRFREAAPLFEKAGDMFREEEDRFEHANARANYLECRLECGEREGLEEIEAEITSLIPILEEVEGRKVRKPLILLGRIQERKGNTAKAITLVKRAIRACENDNTRYPEMDTEYLEQLRS
jgi:tetratricopeptide (TPR) repeat protein